jgi:ABC-type Fe3+-hydroxamate transport system substrate-binding protein
LLISQNAQKKFISLSPSITEIFFEIGAQDSLVGVIFPNNYPKEASKKEVVASYGVVDYERIFALKPDECLTIEGMQSNEELKRIRKLNIAVVEYKMENIDDLCAVIKDIGIKTQKEKSAEEKLLKLEKELEEISKDIVKTKGILVVGLDPTVVVGKGSFLNDVLKKCGVENVFENNSPSYFSPSFEMMIEKKPELLIFPKGEINENKIEELAEKMKKFVPPLKIIQIDADLIMRPSLRILEGMKQLKLQTKKDKN